MKMLYALKCKRTGEMYVGVSAIGKEGAERTLKTAKYNRKVRRTKLGKAVRKYGTEGFTAIIIQDGLNDEDAKKARAEWIDALGTVENGLNNPRYTRRVAKKGLEWEDHVEPNLRAASEEGEKV